MRLLVSGAGGFVGSALMRRLAAVSQNEVFGIYRAIPLRTATAREIVGSCDPEQDWSMLPIRAQALVHTAARVHLMRDRAADPLAEYRRINVAGTLNLARQAFARGLKRFIFISSLKVNGEFTAQGRRFDAADPPAPADPYAVSKAEAEAALRELATETGMEVVILRPPLVYGPGVEANFGALARWVERGLPLPLGSVHNKRSLVYIDNLVDVIVTCLDHTAAVNQTFLVSDGEDVSTPELIRYLGAGLRCPGRTFKVPLALLEVAASLVGRRAAVRRLCGSLQVDISKTRRLLDWTPPIGVADALAITGESFAHEARL